MSTSTKRGARPARSFVTAKRDEQNRAVGVLHTGDTEPLESLSIQELRKIAFATFGAKAGIYILEQSKDALVGHITNWCDGIGVGANKATATDVSEETTADDDDEIITVVVKRNTSIDESKVREIVAQEIEAKVSTPKVVKVGERPEVTITGRTHKQFDALLRKVSARVHLALTGEAGVGKTHLVSQVGQALGLEVTTVTADPLPQRFEILGGVSIATGQAIKGAVFDRYKDGGILLLDEWDTGHVSLSTALNKLLSSSSFDFDVDGGGKVTVPKHPDFVVIATGNTYGNGGSLRYVGTNKLNGAGLDRFTFFHVECDEKLTADLCAEIDTASASKVVPVWTQARRNVEKYNLDYMVTPRCAIDATKLVAVGDTLRDALRGRLFGRGLPADQEAKLLEGISL